MALDLSKLENVRERGGRMLAACPACREVGADRKGEHLIIFDGGGFACIANQGEAGREHRRRIYELAGDKTKRAPHLACYSVRPAAKSQPVAVPRGKREMRLPTLRMPTAEELAVIARLRGWPPPAGLEVLAAREMLFTCSVYDDGKEWPAWLVTDNKRVNGQARRMDGEVWSGIGGAKAKSLPGSAASRCIGASLIGKETQEVWLMEGTPDLCAAAILAKGGGLDLNTLAFVCVTGAGQSLHAEDLSYFAGKPVVIAMHNDCENGAGAKAAKKWTAQLRGAGAGPISRFDFSAYECNDLSDYLALSWQAKQEAPAKAKVDEGSGGHVANTTTTTAPSGLCPKSWALGILAPLGGPTALGNAHPWAEFSPEQIDSDIFGHENSWPDFPLCKSTSCAA